MYDLQCMLFPQGSNNETILVGSSNYIFIIDIMGSRLLKEVIK